MLRRMRPGGYTYPRRRLTRRTPEHPPETRRPTSGRSPPTRPLRRECAPDTRPQNHQRALNYQDRSAVTPKRVASIFGQIEAVRSHSNTLRTGFAHHRGAYGPGGGARLPDRSAARGDEGGGVPPAHWIQYSGPTHARTMEPLPGWPEKSARTGARPHTGSTPQLRVSDPYFSTDHNPAIRKNAP